MSFARAVIEIEPTSLDWLTIEDDDRVWRYRRIGMADLAEPVQVEGPLETRPPVPGRPRTRQRRPPAGQDRPGLARLILNSSRIPPTCT